MLKAKWRWLDIDWVDDPGGWRDWRQWVDTTLSYHADNEIQKVDVVCHCE